MKITGKKICKYGAMNPIELIAFLKTLCLEYIDTNDLEDSLATEGSAINFARAKVLGRLHIRELSF
jgi:hypothetical protein